MKSSLKPHVLLVWVPLIAVLIATMLLVGCAHEGVYHRVEPGQTLYRISRAYHIDEIYLARVNGISDPTELQVGSRLYIPGASAVRDVPVPQKPSPRPAPVASKPKPKSKPQNKPSAKPSVNKKKTPPKARQKPVSTASSSVKLLWPLRGKILRSFGDHSKRGGKGLEIAAPENSTVKAAAAGKVIYSGDGVKGFGHLIIVQHEADIYTVYGFNNRNLVRQGDFVSQGEKIALSGTPPGGGKSRLHFEVRKKKVAVNPILYLP